MKAAIGDVWTVDIKPGGKEYPRTIRVTAVTDTHAETENVDTNRKGKIRLDSSGGVAGYKFVRNEKRTPAEPSSS